MRRFWALGICAVAALAATPAQAATSDYAGNVKGGGKVQLRVKRSPGARRLTRFDFQHVGLSCKGHHRTATGNLSFTKRIENGSFAVRGVNSRGGVIRIKGEIKHRGQRATGTIRLDGTIHVDGDGNVRDCHSDAHPWSANRG